MEQEKIDILYERLEKMESIIEKLTSNGLVYFINIESLQGPLIEKVDGPILDKLDLFTFDKIDVKEVSGALNLGTNLGVKVHKQKEEQKKDSPDEKEQSNNEKRKNEEKYHEIKKQVEEKLETILGVTYKEPQLSGKNSETARSKIENRKREENKELKKEDRRVITKKDYHKKDAKLNPENHYITVKINGKEFHRY